MAFGAGSQPAQPKCLPLCERERARMSLMPSKAWQEVWEATERTLQWRAALYVCTSELEKLYQSF